MARRGYPATDVSDKIVRMTDSISGTPRLPAETDSAVAAWMRRHGWNVLPARLELDPDRDFHVWQEDEPAMGRSHALWVDEAMVRHLSAAELVDVLNQEGVVEDIRVSFKVRIEERGAEYRVSPVPRRSGESRRLE
jgi:hypothetical protein